jgi:hypothetical protein
MFILLLFFSIVFSNLLAQIPEYRMVEMGLPNHEYSMPISINDKGQVFGAFHECWNYHLFIWDDKSGIKTIDLPKGNSLKDAKLNNKGQLALSCREWPSSHQNIYLWDENFGFWFLTSAQAEIDLVGFNDKGQVLLNCKTNQDTEMIISDHGILTNLTLLFNTQYPGIWRNISAVGINNLGDVIFNATKEKQNYSSPYEERAFVWKNGVFRMISFEDEKFSHKENCRIRCMDDEGNIIVDNGREYFIDHSNKSFPLVGHGFSISNGLPIRIGCTASTLKMSTDGFYYFVYGTSILTLLNLDFTCFVKGFEIYAQNSKGYLIGCVYTKHPGYESAFLAIPVESSKDREKNATTMD